MSNETEDLVDCPACHGALRVDAADDCTCPACGWRGTLRNAWCGIVDSAAGLFDEYPTATGVRCLGCGVSDGELHRPGCLEGMYSPVATLVTETLLEAYGMIRDTPARAKPLRIRVCPEPLGGPHWLSLLAQCAWLRGGIIGARVVPEPTF